MRVLVCGDRGTADMITKSKKAGVEAITVEENKR